MGLKEAMTLANSEVVFAVLFILGLFFVGRWVSGFIKDIKAENADRETQLIGLYEKQQENSDKREEHLRGHLDKSIDQMGEISDTMKSIQGGLENLEDRMDANFLEVWKEIGKAKK